MSSTLLAAADLFAQNNNAGGGGGAGILAGLMAYLVFVFVISIISIIGMWKVFEKAGQPGWAAIVPIYNIYILTIEIAKKEMLWFILFVVGCVICGPLAIIAMFVINIEVANKFGKGAGYGVGLTLLGFIFYPMLGFGSARYRGGKKGVVTDFEDEDDDYDRPRRRSSRDDDDDDAPPPPKKKKPRDFDDE